MFFVYFIFNLESTISFWTYVGDVCFYIAWKYIFKCFVQILNNSYVVRFLFVFAFLLFLSLVVLLLTEDNNFSSKTLILSMLILYAVVPYWNRLNKFC